MWQNHVKTLVVQGRFLNILCVKEKCINWKSIGFNLPRNVVKFAVNSCIDTFATNANLKRWDRRLNSKCILCKDTETMHHVLNKIMKHSYEYGDCFTI